MLASIHAPKADNCNRCLSQCDAIPGAFLALFNALISTFFRRVVNSSILSKFIETGKHQKLPARKFMQIDQFLKYRKPTAMEVAENPIPARLRRTTTKSQSGRRVHRI